MKKLVISPHIDDEVLGCGGIIDENTYIFECGIDKNRAVPNWGIVTEESRLEEFYAICKACGARGEVYNKTKVNNYNLRELIPEIECVINKEIPDEIYVPSPTSYNQDHREVYYATMVALRHHDINYFIKKVFLYEQPHVLLWPVASEFNPNYFVEIDIEKKLKLYNLMSSQVRKFRSPETLKLIAQLRGKQCGYEYAEAYQILRWVK